MHFERAAGVLVHPTSFPGRYGIGDLGDNAYRFVDFLVASQQTLWQILPLGPTGYGDSPYQSFSAFAGNPLLISPGQLVRDGYLTGEAVQNPPQSNPTRVDYGAVIEYKRTLFRVAFGTFRKKGTPAQKEAFALFTAEQANWLEDFALFMALKDNFIDHEGGVWNTWPEPIRHREPEAMKRWRHDLANEIKYQKFLQFLFFEQWLALKGYANDRGIRIVGDVPIFVAFDSADVWSNPDFFYLDGDGNPMVVAGVPPDYFSATGQRWGNPLFRWEKMAEDGFPFWRERLRMAFTQVDVVRIDHFRGFEAYWAIPAEEETAVKGEWIKGPGHAFFQAMQDVFGEELPIIAEDLGFITPEVYELRDAFDFPGMKILQFGFGGKPDNPDLPHNYEQKYVVYTGTHDNETTMGWYRNAGETIRDHVRRYLSRDGYDVAWDLIRLAHQSVGNLAIIPLQDLMSLGNSARMNFPGRLGGNWQWRYRNEDLTAEITRRLREITELYGRAPATPEEEEDESGDAVLEERSEA